MVGDSGWGTYSYFTGDQRDPAKVFPQTADRWKNQPEIKAI